MKSNVTGRNYVVLDDGCEYPVVINKNKTDKAIEKLIRNISEIHALMQELLEKSPDIYNLVNDRMLLNFGDNDFFEAVMSCENLIALKNALQNNDDEIEIKKGADSLEKLGYKDRYPWDKLKIYQKVLEDTEEREVVEEIIPSENMRRIRTIIWETTDSGKSSKEIKYRKKPMGKKLQLIVDEINRKAKPEE